MPSMGNSQSQPDDGDNEHDNFVNQDPEPIEDNVVDENTDVLETQKKMKKRKKKRSKDKERVDDDKEKKKEKDRDEEKDIDEPVGTIVLAAPGEKPKKKKKNRQTSQEEESAQALLALNKGLPADVNTAAENEDAGVVDNENSHDDPEPADGHVEEMSEEPKKKKVRRRKNKLPKVKLVDDEVSDAQEVNAPQSQPPQPEDTPPSPLPNQTDDLHPLLHYADLQPAINHNLHEIPDSDRIISQHLAAHMSKHNPPPPPPPPPSNIPDLQDVLMTDDFTGGPITGDFEHDLASLAPPPRGSGKGKGTTGYKRKRLPEDEANKLVDPALRALDAAAEQEEETDDGGGEKVKRKRRLPAESVLPTAPAVKRPPRTRKPPTTIAPIPGSSGAGVAGNGGTFTLEERHAIDTHLTQYMSLHNLTHADLCSRVWSNDRKKDDFWESVCAVLPNRSRASIYKHVRRSYHVFQQRAKWTTEDDEELARLVAEKGSSWKDVGDAMGRMGEDCRDRWRNYVKCGKERGKDRWGEEEETDLRRVLKVVLAGIRAGKTGRDVNEEEVDLEAEEVEGEEDINWTSVSELMGNRRSRIQCRYKWNKMKQQRARIVGASATEGRGGMWRKRKVKVNVDDMKVGDKLWLLEQIRDSGAKEEKQIPWETIAEQSALWASRDLEKGYKLLRSHLQHRRLPLSEIVSRLLTSLNDLPLEIRTERYQPDAIQPAPSQSQQQSGYEYVQQQHHSYSMPLGGHNPAPVVAMNNLTGELDANEYTHHHGGELDMVDPALIGQGGISSGVQQDLEKTAGEAILIAQAAAAAAQVQEAEGLEGEVRSLGMMEEGETERELRRRLGV